MSICESDDELPSILDLRRRLTKQVRDKWVKDLVFGIVYGWDKDPETYNVNDHVMDPYYREFFEREYEYKENKMENQHRKIKGYRELSQEEIDLMNEIKTIGVALGELVGKLRKNDDLDQRWVSIGATDMQTGLMALTRSVAKPEFF